MKSSRKTLPKAYRQLALGVAILVAAVPLLCSSVNYIKKHETTEQVNAFPKVVVTIAPLHSLVAGIMEGVGEPYLLLKAGETPHHYNLKPRDVEFISEADVVIASSFTHEYYLRPLLESLGDRPKVKLQMADAEGVTLLLPVDADEQDEGFDLHLWLDPENAIAFSKQVAEALSAYDPAHADIYNQNLKNKEQAIAKESESIKSKIPSGAHAGYTSYHSVLQYYEHRYGISSGKAAVAVPEAGPSVIEAESVYKEAAAGNLKCVIAETEFSSKLLDGVAAKYPEIKRVVLDPLGGQFKPSPQLYIQLLEHVTDVVRQCLK